MSLPPELRVLCSQLSSTPTTDLPRMIPALLRLILRCQVPLSNASRDTAKIDVSSSSVLVHKLKTQLSTLLSGKDPAGKFVAVVLIKAAVEVGRWEVLQSAESWVRGLLSILGKPDPIPLKELVIISLTKIYSMTQPYQTLVREITTPSISTFISSSLTIISSRSTPKQDLPYTLIETVCRAFSKLLPQHATIYRPFVTQIRSTLRPYLAPTQCDEAFIPQSLRESARQLDVLLLQTAAKNTSGDEWNKAVHGIVREIHLTADQVFRAVVEDWESTTGYIGEPVDIDHALQSRTSIAIDLPPWKGVSAGIERLTGLLEMLAEYFRSPTTSAVSIPIGHLMDIATRMLSIAIPSTEDLANIGSARLHPAIDRDERDGLWAGMPQIHIAALEVVSIMAERLEGGFTSLAPASFDQLLWLFPYVRHSYEFRSSAYRVVAQMLMLVGLSFDKSQNGKLLPIIRCCCHDLCDDVMSTGVSSSVHNKGRSQKVPEMTSNTDNFLRSATSVPQDLVIKDHGTTAAALDLLPLFLSQIPQQHIDVSMRSLIERTAILNKNKEAMLASVLYPFVGKNGKVLATILPHLTREFAMDATVEILLRPRMPLQPVTSITSMPDDVVEDSEDVDMEYRQEARPAQLPLQDLLPHDFATQADRSIHHNHSGPTLKSQALSIEEHNHEVEDEAITSKNGFFSSNGGPSFPTIPSHVQLTKATDEVQQTITAAVNMQISEEDDSDDESVHLNMELDTDSEDEQG